jgi:RsiW-degrading membrane proteinase PrsW (M82 family)
LEEENPNVFVIGALSIDRFILHPARNAKPVHSHQRAEQVRAQHPWDLCILGIYASLGFMHPWDLCILGIYASLGFMPI